MTITYARHIDGFVYSRVGDEIAFPVLEFAEIGQGGVERSTGIQYEAGNFTGPTNYHLEKSRLHNVSTEWSKLTWTKKIALNTKNEHRRFWGLKPLKPVLRNELDEAICRTLPSDFDRCIYDIKNGLNGQPHIYTWQQIAQYLRMDPAPVKLSFKIIKERM